MFIVTKALFERFNRTFAERLFGYQYAEELQKPQARNKEWVQRVIGKKPSSANKKRVKKTLVYYVRDGPSRGFVKY